MIRKFEEKDIEQAAKLLAIRHKKERIKYPSLNSIFEESTLLESLIKKNYSSKRTIAVAAWDEGNLVGFIISHVKTDTVFGRCAWVKYDGMAIAEGTDASLYREMYAEIANKWLEVGCLKHFVIVPAGQEEVLQSWLYSGFAYEQVFGIKALLPTECVPIEGVTVRVATVEDKEDLESISGLIMSYQAQSPTYAAALPEMYAEIREGYGGLVEDDEAHVLLAYEEEGLLGFTCGYFEGDNHNDMMVPYKSSELGVAATSSMAQNRGVGTLLSQVLFRDARGAGYENSTTDWRITNLKSSKFWPKMGYEPYAYRFVRTIDSRAYWAKEDKGL